MASVLLNDRLLSHAGASTRATAVNGPVGHARPSFRHRLAPPPPSRHLDADNPVSAALSVRWVVAHALGNGSGPSTVLPAPGVTTEFVAETLLPTRTGNYRLRGYRHTVDDGVSYTEPSVIISGNVEDQENVPVRVHDACFTSEVLGSLKCDCAQQLQLALEYIQNKPPGVVIYLQQEGRGIGLANKIAAYALQEKGLDTVDANRALGFPDDCREYTPVPSILRDLRIKSIQLMTNNPRKLVMLQELGIRITGRIPCIVKAGEHNQDYLSTKQKRMSHLLGGGWCYWNHDGEPNQPVKGLKEQGSILPSSPRVSDGILQNLASEE